MSQPICPRCGGFIPNNEMPGAYPGAMSRLTAERNVEICSACGTAEAMEQFSGGPGAIMPMSAWKSATMPVDGDTQRST